MATIGVHKDPATGQVEMQFLTCSAMLPDKPGLFFLSPSCGSGKSTCIAAVGKEKKDLGVLIVVPTKKDADEMGNRLATLGVPVSQIFVLHCQNIAALDKYRTTPSTLSDIPILIVTSVRIQIDPFPLFLSYKGGTRGYIFIDELINFYPDPFQIPNGLYEIVSYLDQHKTHNGRKAIDEFTVDGITWFRHIYDNEKAMEAAYKLSGKSGKALLPDKTPLDRIKRSMIFQHIIDSGFTPIDQRIQDIAGKSVTCLFDGTADVIFPKKDPRVVAITGDRYSSDIQFSIFPFRMKRHNLEYCQANDIQRLAPEFVNLATKLSQSEKVLIISWKTVDGKAWRALDGRTEHYEGQEDAVYGFPDILKQSLAAAGAKMENISITYRGSGQDRGSNEYRECSSVIFLGSWNLPEEPVTEQISAMFGFRMNYFDYRVSLLVQTVCRSRIRMHQGLPIKVYFSSDINYNMAYAVQEYFQANSASSCNIGGLIKPCRVLSKPDKGNLYDITRLYAYDPLIRRAVESGTTYAFSIPHSTLFGLVPKDRKSKARYSRLIQFMKAFGITMTIT